MSETSTKPENIPVVDASTFMVDKNDYLSRDVLAREKRRLWPRVWQVACREEEIPNLGDYVTYDIGDESFIVVRAGADEIRCYYNVCLHRGRRLTEGFGRVTRFHCRFHGWQWNLDGSNARVLDHEDWDGCPSMNSEDLSLAEAQVAIWAGFVFINMDLDAEPLAEYLDPVPEFVDCFEMERMRYRWYKSLRLPCNWKVALEAFDEGYHVAATHSQMLEFQGDDVTRSATYGKHGMFGYPDSRALYGSPSPRLNKPAPDDIRPNLLRGIRDMDRALKAIRTERDVEAAHRLLTEVPADTPHLEVLQKLGQFQREAAIASGAGWPDITPEQQARAGTDWHVFPNLIFLMAPTGALAYRSRPDPLDPDWCTYDIWSLERYPRGAEPPIKREFYHSDTDWQENPIDKVGLILSQDLQNMHQVQQGMKSSGFEFARTNPLQESAIANFHRVLHEYLSDDAA